MSGNDVIDEACSCGATFHVRGWGPSITNAAKHWRQTHRHEMPTPTEHVEAATAGPPPHRCEACLEALDWEADDE